MNVHKSCTCPVLLPDDGVGGDASGGDAATGGDAMEAGDAAKPIATTGNDAELLPDGSAGGGGGGGAPALFGGGAAPYPDLSTAGAACSADLLATSLAWATAATAAVV